MKTIQITPKSKENVNLQQNLLFGQKKKTSKPVDRNSSGIVISVEVYQKFCLSSVNNWVL
jgi:hypothetical protein